MRLYNQRKRQKAMDAAEAAGENIWHDDFDGPARVGIRQALSRACRSHPPMIEDVVFAARLILTQDEHVHTLSGFQDPSSDLWTFLEKTADDGQVASVIEAISWRLRTLSEDYAARFEEDVNDLMRSERIAHELVNSEMVALESQELHSEVVVPTLRLLAGRPRWEKVERAYQEALHQVADGRFDNAITDAGTALQEALETAGCSGRNLGPLISEARKKGILGPHDSQLVTGIEKIMEWVSADRSQRGDGHDGNSVANHEDAFLTIHVVGALILRLAKGGPRNR